MFRECPSEQNDGEIDGRVTIQEHCKALLLLKEKGTGSR